MIREDIFDPPWDTYEESGGLEGGGVVAESSLSAEKGKSPLRCFPCVFLHFRRVPANDSLVSSSRYVARPTNHRLYTGGCMCVLSSWMRRGFWYMSEVFS